VEPTLSPNIVRFGVFELDLRARELRKNGLSTGLPEQSVKILAMLLEQHGAVVLREEIRKKLWPNDTAVEFDHGINAAIKRLRQALGDAADHPCFIETLARRGYRWIAQMEVSALSQPGSRPAPVGPGYDARLRAEHFIGKKVSHYRVLEILGGGGMGVVYKAEDLKLGRRVALKFLPEELGNDTKALERFEREARAVSALEHLNICPIYEFGEHEGQPFMVMPLLEGQTLRDRLAALAAPFSTDEFLHLATQIADGLEAAHEKGIIHRDIKPANIFITNRGAAKILDFGLAKLTVAGEDPVIPKPPEALLHREMSDLPEGSLSLTRTGMALGTAAYMSPEQVRGEKLDARTDLFSFGLVLYEMATGQQAFSGETAAILHHAILNRAPAPVQELNPEIPSKLEGIINKALNKDREQRYQFASEIRAGLEYLKRETSRRRRGGRRPMAIAGFLALLLVGGTTLWFTNRQASSWVGLPELKQRQLTANSSENAVLSGAISPDGRYLAYADMQGIHIKQIETGETRNVPQPEELKGLQVSWGIVPTWVRDGSRFIANANIPGQEISVWAISVTGGPPRELRHHANAASVSRDGNWVAFVTRLASLGYREVWMMKPDGEQAQKLYEANENSGFDGGEWSPDGQRLSLGFARQVDDKLEVNIVSRGLKGEPAVVAIPGGIVDHTWSPDGRIIYSLSEPGPVRDSCNYWGKRIDAGTGKPLEAPRRLTSWAGFCMDNTSATADGKRLAFRKWSWQGSVYVADLEANGARISTPTRLTLNEGRSYPAAWTADSKAVVFGSYRDGEWKIFKQSLGADSAEPIVAGTETMAGAGTGVSPDGTFVLYSAPSNQNGSSSALGPDLLMRVPITGGRPEVTLTARIYDRPVCAKSPANLCAIAEQTPDRKQLVFTSFDPVRGRVRELTRFNTDPTSGAYYVWDLSPDGTRIAILKYSERPIHILSVDGKPPQEIVVKGWSSLQSVNWAADGNGLFASSATRGGSALLHLDLQGNTHVLWEQKGSIAGWYSPLGGPSAPWVVASPDGRHLAIYDWKLSANMWTMENF
jgi:serine/threonine protein kinase/DNA-binding winged helix-turn-helix (wHTH) protein